MFLVVQFTSKDKAYNVVPDNWFDGDLVTWHRSPVFARSCKAPLNTWPKYAAKLADPRHFSSYDEAEMRMDEIIYDQTASEADMAIPAPIVLNKRVITKRKHADYAYSSDGGEIEDPLANFDDEPPVKQLSSPDPLLQCSAELPSLDNDSQIAYTVTANSDMTEVLKLVRELAESSKLQSIELRSVKAQLNNVTSELRKVKVALRGVDAPLPVQSVAEQNIQKSLPISSYEDLLLFESTLNRAEFTEFLAKIGGKTVQKMLANLVSAVYSSELQVATTWKGRRAADGSWAKDPLGTAATPLIIASVVQSAYPKNTTDDVLTMLQKHLQHVTDRAKRMSK